MKPCVQARELRERPEGIPCPKMGLKEKYFAPLPGMLSGRRMVNVRFQENRKVYAENHNQSNPGRPPGRVENGREKAVKVMFQSRNG